jgi:hypothetical protein
MNSRKDGEQQSIPKAWRNKGVRSQLNRVCLVSTGRLWGANSDKDRVERNRDLGLISY